MILGLLIQEISLKKVSFVWLLKLVKDFSVIHVVWNDLYNNYFLFFINFIFLKLYSMAFLVLKLDQLPSIA